LTQFNELIKIKANKDWRKALEMPARRFRQKKIAEMLPSAYAAYATYALEFDEDLPPETIVADRVAHYVLEITSMDYQTLEFARDMLLDGRASLDGVRDLKIF
jgi:hypothetical protein